MDTLRQKLSELFNVSTPIKEKPKSKQPEEPQAPKEEKQNRKPITSKKEEEQTVEPITSGDFPTPEIKLRTFGTEPNRGDFSYEMEFIDFVDRNAPKGLSKKLTGMFPYLEVSFLSWPAYWFYRGYNWQHKRNTERISFYIQRTHQQAKFMQFAILTTGLLAVTMARSPSPNKVENIEFKKPNESPLA